MNLILLIALISGLILMVIGSMTSPALAQARANRKYVPIWKAKDSGGWLATIGTSLFVAAALAHFIF